LAGTPLLHFSKRLEVLIWPLRRVSQAEPVATDLRDAVVSPTLP